VLVFVVPALLVGTFVLCLSNSDHKVLHAVGAAVATAAAVFVLFFGFFMVMVAGGDF
jgi:hypothetical protein